MTIRVPKYWLFQIVGWGLFVLMYFFFAFTFEKITYSFVSNLIIFVTLGVSFSHIMRAAIIRTNVLIQPIQQQLIGLAIITIFFALTLGVLQSAFTYLLNLRTNTEKSFTETKVIISNTFHALIYLFVWNCIYFIYHYIEKNRKQQVDTLKLEALVKELELKTIKAHINPHFIFNALNSIRALIDENPGRARTAVTELSNILRSSMQAEKLETVTLEKELNIVKDYLALEHIRFEERLRIEYEIEEDTLDLPVPPMMLQTLVENAIKHGISKQLEGGSVKIISSFTNKFHELKVQNTGYLNGSLNVDGFGLASTENRLHLMFGDKAHFQISEIVGNMVEAKIQIPVPVTFA
jgi:two-component system LytT family sensor kinase